MSDDGEALAARGGGPADHVLLGAVVADHVEVDRREAPHRMTQVAHYGKCLEEDLAALRAAAEKELSETKAALEAAIESKTQFLVAMGQQIQSHLGAEGTAEPKADAENQGGDTKVTPLRRARAGK